MQSIKGTTITLTRGDTLIVHLNLRQNNVAFSPESGDVIEFKLGYKQMNAARTAFVREGAIIEKVIDNTDMILRLDPEDTKDLEFNTYVYDLQITFEDGRVDTFINCGNFILKPEV